MSIFDLINTASWTEQAVCVDAYADAFFPSTDSPGMSKRVAKAACAECPVKAECLDMGMSEDHGIWGGLDEKERKRLKRRRAS